MTYHKKHLYLNVTAVVWVEGHSVFSGRYIFAKSGSSVHVCSPWHLNNKKQRFIQKLVTRAVKLHSKIIWSRLLFCTLKHSLTLHDIYKFSKMRQAWPFAKQKCEKSPAACIYFLLNRIIWIPEFVTLITILCLWCDILVMFELQRHSDFEDRFHRRTVLLERLFHLLVTYLWNCLVDKKVPLLAQ